MVKSLKKKKSFKLPLCSLPQFFPQVCQWVLFLILTYSRLYSGIKQKKWIQVRLQLGLNLSITSSKRKMTCRFTKLIGIPQICSMQHHGGKVRSNRELIRFSFLFSGFWPYIPTFSKVNSIIFFSNLLEEPSIILLALNIFLLGGVSQS